MIENRHGRKRDEAIKIDIDWEMIEDRHEEK